MNESPLHFQSEDIKLNLGSGNRPLDGYVNVDILDLEGVDVVCDLEKKLPFKDNSVIEVRGAHVLEHIDNLVPLLEELYRICKDGAELHFRIPYMTSESAFKDPTHKHFISERTFSYFSRKAQHEEGLPEYGLSMDFDIIGYEYLYYKRWFALAVIGPILKRYCWNIVKTMVVSLKVIKPARTFTA